MSVLVMEGVSRSFGTLEALRDVTFSVGSGVVCGLIGPNGAGKSTVLGLLLGLLAPDSGLVQVSGKNPLDTKDSPLGHVGAQIDQYGMFPSLSALDYVRYVGCLYGVDARMAKSRAEDLLFALDLGEACRRRVGDLSLGNRKKVGIAAALVHKPSVLLLDEPMESLDPWSQRLVAELISGFVQTGRTVLMSSHNLAMVERLCTQVIFLDEGCIRYDGFVSDLTAKTGLELMYLKTTKHGLSEGSLLERISWL